MDRLQGSMEALSALQITEDMDGLDVQPLCCGTQT